MKDGLSIARAFNSSLETEKCNVHPGLELQAARLEEGRTGLIAAKEVAATNTATFALKCCSNIGHRRPQEPQLPRPPVVLLQKAVLVVLEV